MEKSNTVNFKGLFYAKSAIFASEIRKGVKSYLLEPYPNNLLKDVIESSPIFNDLQNKTDVYISSYMSKDTESSNGFVRYVRAIFKDPYSKNRDKIDSINLEANGEEETIVFEKLKNIAKNLPIYKSFEHNAFILLGKNGSDGYIRRGLNF